MVGETIEQSCCHLRIAEHARPFAEGEIGGHDHRAPLVEAANQVEQQLPTGQSERQITKFVEDDEVEAREIIGEASLSVGTAFGLKPVDQIDG
jgi:hypothetical protein